MAKEITVVLGSSGQVGQAIVRSLSESYSDKVAIKACTRDPAKASDLSGLAAVEVIEADIGASSLTDIIQPFGATSAFIVTPGVSKNADLVGNAAQACKAAGVKSLAVISDPTVSLPDACTLGRLFSAVERAVKEVDVPYTILRLPYFYSNLQYHASTIKDKSSIIGPSRPDVQFTGMAVSDIGKAAAAILANPLPHANKTYTLGSTSHSFDDVTQALSKSLGREIKYVHQSYEEFKQLCMDRSWPEWLVEGLIDYFKLVDCGSPAVCHPSGVATFKSITGCDPITVQQWLAQVPGVFQ